MVDLGPMSLLRNVAKSALPNKRVLETKHFAPQGGSVLQSSARQNGPQNGPQSTRLCPPKVDFWDFRRFFDRFWSIFVDFLTGFGRFSSILGRLLVNCPDDFGSILKLLGRF